jgi:hypothetical protein
VLSISMVEAGGPGRARVEFAEDMATPDHTRPAWSLARAVAIGAGETSARAIFGRISDDHWLSTEDDTAKVRSVTEPWHCGSSDRWSYVGDAIRVLSGDLCRRHASAITALAEALSAEQIIDGPRVLEILRPHVDDAACEESRADIQALALRLGDPMAPTETES